MILHLLAECINHYAATGAELYVLIDNLQAINCYKSLGFDFIGDDIEIDLKYSFKTIRKMRIDFQFGSFD